MHHSILPILFTFTGDQTDRPSASDTTAKVCGSSWLLAHAFGWYFAVGTGTAPSWHDARGDDDQSTWSSGSAWAEAGHHNQSVARAKICWRLYEWSQLDKTHLNDCVNTAWRCIKSWIIIISYKAHIYPLGLRGFLVLWKSGISMASWKLAS